MENKFGPKKEQNNAKRGLILGWGLSQWTFLYVDVFVALQVELIGREGQLEPRRLSSRMRSRQPAAGFPVVSVAKSDLLNVFCF